MNMIRHDHKLKELYVRINKLCSFPEMIGNLSESIELHFTIFDLTKSVELIFCEDGNEIVTFPRENSSFS